MRRGRKIALKKMPAMTLSKRPSGVSMIIGNARPDTFASDQSREIA